ncbi:glycoside hydrolase family 15 protein [Rhodoferax ferrireducens]|uniref:glycoside hydrolase family 15 protein n=1 Tax=Rhodoferax ferrireducens TaxID=192843 RepID=UPI00298DBD5F|nr:glycoside hydrolase family 15 protein [Rhodoferax ferrireducens]WPC66774.1 glycoside hydrolase family 15 protein [Rhodoferax ferrireducens]
MPLPIQDYALIGDCHTAALVGRDGSIDWLCLPRFDAGACFAALLGSPDHGRWLLAPAAEVRAVRRRYRDGTLILETEFDTDDGAVRVIDCMPLSKERCDLVRIVEGLRGRVHMRMELVIRFDYGAIVPWVRRTDGTLLATAGPDTLELHTTVPTHGEQMKTVAEFEVGAGERMAFVLSYRPSHEAQQPPIDPEQALQQTQDDWLTWSQRCTYQGRWRAAVLRSLITLKALTYQPTGGIVAAPTSSLPEQRAGVRNWDYRYCWLRDATFTLNALLLTGYTEEALAWREWLLRAVAGSPADLQILYSVTGVRRLDEIELDWLPGYGHAAPVRVGNAAAKQFQLDVYGEVMDTLHLVRAAGLPPEPHVWEIQRALLDFLDTHWQGPDEGIWEMRGPQRQFTHSKVMAWLAFDRAVKAVERFGLDGPVNTWRVTRDTIHAQVCELGFDARRNSFVQYYGAADLDASLLMIPLVGFLPPDDARVRGTVEAIQRELMVDGLVMRYATASGVDRLPPGEGAFLPCTFWLADSLALIDRRDEAEALFERLLALCNDVGLLSEEFDPRSGDMLGNFPLALTHVALINTAWLLSLPQRQIEKSCEQGERPAAAVPPAVQSP